MDGAGALCEVEGEALRRALAVAFADEALAARSTATAFVRARRRWQALAAMPEPMVWIDVMAVRAARRRLARLERRWRPSEDPGGGTAALSPRARVAVVLHTLRGRSPDDVADALATSRADADALLRDAYRSLGVVDVVIEDDVVPYAAEELRAELVAAAAQVPGGRTSTAREVERRVRRATVVRAVVGVAAVTAVAGAIVLGPQAGDRRDVASGPAPIASSLPLGTAGRLLIPGVSAPIAVVGLGELAVHDPQTGDRSITPVTRLNGATSATTAVALGPWIVVATGGGPGSRAFALDTRDPSAPPRPLGAAVKAVASATAGLVWLVDAGGLARQVTLGGLAASDPVRLPGPLVGVTDLGLVVQTEAGVAVLDPATALVRWSQPGATALAADGRAVAWCRDACGRVDVTDIGGATHELAASPGAVGSYGAPAAFSPDGRWLAVTRGRIVVVHDVTGPTPPSVLSGGGTGDRSFTWASDWLVFSGGSALEVAKAPSFSALRYVDAGTDVRAVVALGVIPEAGGPTVIAGGPFFGDGWYVRAGIHTIDTVTDVCFGVFGPPFSECMPTEGAAVEARLIGSGPTQTVVGIVRDLGITQVRVIRSGTTDPVRVESPELVRVQGGHRVFAWRAAAGSGVAHVDGLAADGEFVAGIDVPLS